MKKAAFLSFIFALCLQAGAAEYTLTSTDSTGQGVFRGFSNDNFTASPELLPEGITSEDSVIIDGFYDIVIDTINVENFTFISSGAYGNGLTFSAGANVPVIRARNINFCLRDASTQPTFININNESVTFAGSLNNANSNLLLPQNDNIHTPGNKNVYFQAFDENTPSVSYLNNVIFYYSRSREEAQAHSLQVDAGATLNVSSIYTGSITEEHMAAGYSTTININGGTLNASSIQYFFDSEIHAFTINHLSGTLGARNNITLTKNGLAGTLNYAIGENAIFNTRAESNAFTITLSSDVVLSRSSAEGLGGFTVRGGGALAIDCDVSAVNGAVNVEDSSTLRLGSWLANAQKVSIEAGSQVEVSSEISLGENSHIVLGVNSAEDFAKLVGTISDSENIGTLEFAVGGTAGDTFSIAYTDLISDSSLDWSNFDIISNVDYYLGADSITFNVPEPAHCAVLLGLAAGALAALRKRRR